MATAIIATQPGVNAGVGSRGGMAGLRRIVGEFREYFRTLEELRELSPRELADLGLAHSDIRRIARDAVWGK